MKRILLSLSLIGILLGNLSGLWADPVDLLSAQQIATHFYQAKTGMPPSALTLAMKAETSLANETTRETAQPLYYWFNVGTNEGFVLVAGDDRLKPVLAYGDQGSPNVEDMPDALAKWLAQLRKEARYIIQENIPATREIIAEWAALQQGPGSTTATRAVAPLMSTTWNQAPFYNSLCPIDGGSPSVTGCVATAMAQVMKYWNYPSQGTGFHSYNHPNLGTISANFGATTYDWASMPNSLNSNNTAVATLMYHCGVSVEMNYSANVSGAYVINAASPIQHCTEYAMTTYFGYDANTLQGVLRSNYTTSSWVQLLKGELDAGRPIVYAGFGGGGGHAWVCDGYDNSDFFHMNWGWGGNSDGYFWVDALNPGSLGTGGGTGGFNSNQQAVIGIEPPGGGGNNPPSASELTLTQALIATPNPAFYGSNIQVNFNVVNGNSNTPTFSGEIAAALFDANGAFVDFIGTYTESGLPGNFTYNPPGLTFSYTVNVVPGQYFIGSYARPTNGDWVIIGAGGFNNFIPFTVTVDNDIRMNSDFTLTPQAIRQDQPFDVNVNVYNAGNTTFTGTYSIDLHNLDGSYVQELASLTENNGLPPGFTYTGGMNFQGIDVSNIEPGSYLLALWEQVTNGDWELVASEGTFVNPINITIAAPGLSPDIYEDNDIPSNAYPLTLSFGGNQANQKTTGSNIHTELDYDYYRIDLAAGSGYTITARAQDSWDSNDGQPYTNDVLFSYSFNGTDYSEAYDDVMPGPITVNGPRTVYFKVAPYFQGEKGTYALDLQVVRGAVNIKEAVATESATVYPNPAHDKLFVELPQYSGALTHAALYDQTGRQVWQPRHIPAQARQFSLSGFDLPAGVYVLKLRTEQGQWKETVIIE